ncbi:MAG: LPXTG cell wall anchor domain-containing protein [Cellulomonadaceae bacterium]
MVVTDLTTGQSVTAALTVTAGSGGLAATGSNAALLAGLAIALLLAGGGFMAARSRRTGARG